MELEAVYTHPERWQHGAAILGPPIYGVPGLEPEPAFGSGATGLTMTHLRLQFGSFNRLEVETSIDPMYPEKMLRQLGMELAGLDELAFPLTIDEHKEALLIDSENIEFQVLSFDASHWFGAAEIQGRWVSLRGRDILFDETAIGSIDPITWQ